MRAYALDVRQQVIARLAAGHTVAAVAAQHHLSARSVRRWRQRWQRGETLVPQHSPGRTPLIGPAAAPRLLALVHHQPQATLHDLCTAWRAETGQQLSPATMCRTLRRLGVTRHRRPDGIAHS